VQPPSQKHGRLWPPEFRHHEPICPRSEDGPHAPCAHAATAEPSGRLGPAPITQRLPLNPARPRAITPRAEVLALDLHLGRRLHNR